MITSEQVRAARAYMRWKQSDLAKRTGLSLETIKRIEKMEGPLVAVNAATIYTIVTIFRLELLEFTEDRSGMGLFRYHSFNDHKNRI